MVISCPPSQSEPHTAPQVASQSPAALPSPTVWQACLNQLAAELRSRGLDPRQFVFLVSRNHFSLFAVSPTESFCLSVFGRTLCPLAVSATEAAAMTQRLSQHPFPFAWAGC